MSQLVTENASEMLQEYADVHMNVFGTPLRVLDHGEGMYVWDIDGKRYLDFLAGIAVNSVGYAHPSWVEAVSHQAQTIAHTSNYFATVPQIQLAKRLLQYADAPEGSHVYFCNSGAEANEAALKLAKLHATRYLHCDNKRPYRIVALEHGFHGRTMGALSATWKPAIRTPFEPLVPNVEFVEANNVDALVQSFTGSTTPVAAVIVELIQGEAGVLPLDVAFVQKIRQLCDEYHALMICDEVQTGIGRTGAWFAFQRDDLTGGILPDVVTFAKGVAGGFPMGGMIGFGDTVCELFTPGSHGSTFAGNPLAASAALATLNIIEQEDLIDNAQRMGAYLVESLTRLRLGNTLFDEIRGRGLLQAVTLKRPCAHHVMKWALDHGLIINAPNNSTLRFAPPLIVSSENIDDAMSILAQLPEDLDND